MRYIEIMNYNPQIIEQKWQKKWEQSGINKTPDRVGGKKNYYCLVEFPYPSGAGLHVGHCRSYTAMDVIVRKRKMQGFNVLFPMGWDAFGLPTENYAIKTGEHPAVVTQNNTANFKRQEKSLGLSFDWSREINTTDPKYYKWTQWLFVQLFKKGLAYKAKIPINWCVDCKIGLSNEEVVDGKCERCGGKITKKEKEQWMLRITNYADRLLNDLDKLDYPRRVKSLQQDWIGRSEGINIEYRLKGAKQKITIFTTRPDTNFGATFIVLAPDCKFAQKNFNLFPNKLEARKYIEKTKTKTDLERVAEGQKKTGVFTGLYAVNSLNDKEMPVYVSDFVLSTVGTGAVVGVPGHDLRDFEFAKEMGLDIIRVVVGPDRDTGPITSREQVQEENGTMINSGFLNGMDIHKATEKIKDYLEKKGWGKRAVNYKLRDWVFSRQRYWGEPIPMTYCKKCGWRPVKEKDLPVELPDVKNYKPTQTGESPLAALAGWLDVKCPRCRGRAQRETDVMPNWAGSNWYFLRYCDPDNDKELADKELLRKWMPVDWYNGGMEHATLHLLYSRFIYKFLWDIEAVPKSCGSEPYEKRTSHGMILGEGGVKMSKSKGNVINPDKVIEEYGADTLRVYEMFMGPFSQAISWNTNGVKGARRFLEKIWKLSSRTLEKDFAKESHKALKTFLEKAVQKISDDVENMKFNTAVSALMSFVGEWWRRLDTGKSYINREDFKRFLTILSPFAPHLSEELWSKMGNGKSVFLEKWPKAQKNRLTNSKITLIVQVNGRVRDKIDVEQEISRKEAEKLALSREKVQKYIKDKTVKKIIFVPGRLINLVV